MAIARTTIRICIPSYVSYSPDLFLSGKYSAFFESKRTIEVNSQSVLSWSSATTETRVIVNEGPVGTWLWFFDIDVLGTNTIGIISVETGVWPKTRLMRRKPLNVVVAQLAVREVAVEV